MVGEGNLLCPLVAGNITPYPLPDFAALPPEVNSGRMYSGPGAGSLLAAMAAWDCLAADLQSASAAYSAAIWELASLHWRGPAADSMVGAILPYVTWLTATATLAEQAAVQSRTAAAAYELAFSLTVPPPVIAANRVLLMTLVATNWFGQNAPAIATTEFHYAEMWVQDATAMQEYAGSSTAALTPIPFIPPPRTTNAAAVADQALQAGQAAPKVATASTYLACVHAVAALVEHHLVAAIAAIPWNTLLQYWTDILSAVAVTEAFVYDAGGYTLNVLQVGGAMIWSSAAAPATAGAAVVGPAGAAAWSSWPQLGAAPPAASVGLADKIGPMSVPPSWVTSTPTRCAPCAQTVSTSIPGLRTAVRAGEVSGLLQGVPPRRAGQVGGNYGRRYGERIRVMCRPPNAG
ncbi:PPE family protein [Mycobacterium simiae]|uniref:PPE family protein n=1 Tax=Mycobacterium simiae TaxID=1784 RepID=A0A5B1BQC6_MYCSI|nr:PPE family protein [Mycobacterium simiae]KAA1249553.1 PPE family protein [Mycobacterium simiae]